MTGGVVEGLAARLAQVGVQVVDGDLAPGEPGPGDRPSLIVYGGVAAPAHRLLDGTTAAATVAARVVCVSNNPAGARWLASQTVALLDGWRQDRACWRVGYVSEPVEDRGDPSAWRWTTTVEATCPTQPVRRSITP